MLPVVGILFGDAAGIGPELVAKLCVEGAFNDKCRPIIIGDARVVRQGFEIIGAEPNINCIDNFEQAQFGAAIDVLDLKDISPDDYTIGTVDIKCGESAYICMKYSLDMLMKGQIHGMLYAPQNKTSFTLAGHELDSMDFMCRYLGVERFGELNVLDKVCTVRVTSHIPLREVPDALTEEGVLDAITFSQKSLSAIGHDSGRIAVMGLNPHNGENGLCGREEIDIIAPAVEKANKMGINTIGPISPDTAFVRAFRGEFDVVVTMYHDQGQIAMKLTDFTRIVTVIGGPDYPIATPAHGTAFDIAGKGIADTGAINCALDIVCRGAKKIASAQKI